MFKNILGWSKASQCRQGELVRPTQPLDYHKEYSFRRGYVHGVEQIITTLRGKLSTDDLLAIESWREELLIWQYSKGSSVFEHPPLPVRE